jgi:hypothetical protein
MKAEGRRMKSEKPLALIQPSSFILHPFLTLLPLKFMHRVLAEALAVLFHFEFGRAAGDFDLRAIV